MKDITVLHDHLDGGLRANTIIELANNLNIELPTKGEHQLEKWFFENISSQKNQVFNKFELTISIMQDSESLQRIAFEAVEDLRRDNISTGELRYAPLQHLRKGLTPQEVVEAVSIGLSNGMKKFGGNFKSILCAMRQNNDSLQVADLAIKNYSIGVVGFDLAGPEFGHPPSKHIDACEKINDSNIGLTIHAGEAADFSYIEDAVMNCKAKRIGHGWQIIEGCSDNGDIFSPNTETSEYILEKQIPLEICISSNIKSGASNVALDNHPAVKLLRSGFNVTLNPDNRLMASTTLSREYEIAKKFMSLTEDEESKLLENAKNSTFA